MSATSGAQSADVIIEPRAEFEPVLSLDHSRLNERRNASNKPLPGLFLYPGITKNKRLKILENSSAKTRPPKSSSAVSLEAVASSKEDDLLSTFQVMKDCLGKVLGCALALSRDPELIEHEVGVLRVSIKNLECEINSLVQAKSRAATSARCDFIGRLIKFLEHEVTEG